LRPGCLGIVDRGVVRGAGGGLGGTPHYHDRRRGVGGISVWAGDRVRARRVWPPVPARDGPRAPPSLHALRSGRESQSGRLARRALGSTAARAVRAIAAAVDRSGERLRRGLTSTLLRPRPTGSSRRPRWSGARGRRAWRRSPSPTTIRPRAWRKRLARGSQSAAAWPRVASRA